MHTYRQLRDNKRKMEKLITEGVERAERFRGLRQTAKASSLKARSEEAVQPCDCRAARAIAFSGRVSYQSFEFYMVCIHSINYT